MPKMIIPGIYIHKNNKSAVVVTEDGELHQGSIQIRRKKYRYIVWRVGRDVKNTYIGQIDDST